MMTNPSRPMLGALLVLVCMAAAAMGRTIVVDASVVDSMAAIDAVAPRQGWAMHLRSEGTYSNEYAVLEPQRSFLIRFPLDMVPADQRIVHAELVVNVSSYSGNEPRFYIWRTLASWGAGVCHDYRKVDGEDYIAWTKPGAAGISSDRATQPTDVIRLTENGDVVINVTEDVELWYTGAAPNEGWMLTVEDPEVRIVLPSPAWTGQAAWRLRLTYEPKE